MIMRQSKSLIWLGLLPLLVAASASDSHPLHTSRAVVEFNSETSSFEVSLCIFPDDLEQALSKRLGRKVTLHNEPEIDEALKAFVDGHFQLRVRGGTARPIQWVGHEQETQQAWLYFEFPFENGTPTDVEIKNTLLMDQFDDQINVAYVRIGERQRCLTYRTDTTSWQSWTVTRNAAK